MKVLKVLLVLLFTGVSGAAFLYFGNNFLSKSSIIIESGRIPESFDGFRIVQLSDLHSKYFGENQSVLVDAVKGMNPDIIVMTGDMVDGRRYDEKPVLELIKALKSEAPIYYVTGNHEWWSGKFNTFSGRIKSSGAVSLRNRNISIERGGSTIYIAGIDDPEEFSRRYKISKGLKKEIETALKGVGQNYKILLSHRPEYIDIYESYGIDIVFSGHAHGGQIRFPFIGGVFAPGQGFMPKYTSGLCKKGATSMIVNRGLGNSEFPFRIFNRPEVVCVTLKAKK